MEWVQIVFLLLAAGGFAWKLRQRPILEDRLTWWGMLLLVLFFAERELDIRVVTRLPIAMQAEKGFRIAIELAILWFLFRAVPRWPALLRNLPRFLASRCCVAFVTGCFLYVVASQIDRLHSAEHFRREFAEELVEFHATFLLLIASR